MSDNPFEYKSMAEHQLTVSQHIRDSAMELHTYIKYAPAPGRYLSLALTSLEEAVLWANKAICFDWSGKKEG